MSTASFRDTTAQVDVLARAWPLVLALGGALLGLAAAGLFNLVRYSTPYLFQPTSVSTFPGGFAVVVDREDIHAYSEKGQFLWSQVVGFARKGVRLQLDEEQIIAVNTADNVIHFAPSGQKISESREHGAYRRLPDRAKVLSANGDTLAIDKQSIVLESSINGSRVIVSGPSFPSTSFGLLGLILAGGQGLVCLASVPALRAHHMRSRKHAA